MVDPFAELTFELADTGDCGCDEQLSGPGFNDMFQSDEIPSPRELEALVDQTMAASADSMNDLDLALAESMLEDGMELPRETDENVTLQDIIALTEQHPGMKVTISFG